MTRMLFKYASLLLFLNDILLLYFFPAAKSAAVKNKYFVNISGSEKTSPAMKLKLTIPS